jgi:hypothetical protein
MLISSTKNIFVVRKFQIPPRCQILQPDPNVAIFARGSVAFILKPLVICLGLLDFEDVCGTLRLRGILLFLGL